MNVEHRTSNAQRRRWEFSGDYIQIVLHHNNLQAAESLSDELLMVHFSNLLAKEMGYTAYGKPEVVDLMDAPSAGKLKIEGPQMAVLKHHVKAKMANAAEFGN